MRPCKDIAQGIPVNAIIAGSQDEYQTLYANMVSDTYGLLTFAVELDDDEIAQIQEHKRLYVQQLTFGQPMQPLVINTDPNDVQETIDAYVRGNGL